jgi:uncharacterized membrane protein YccC
MDGKELQLFWERVEIAMPAVYDWLRRNSPDVGATLREWSKALKNFTLEECMAVIDAYMAEDIPQPKGFQLAAFASDVAAVARQARTKLRRIEAMAAASMEARKISARRPNILVTCGDVFGKCGEIRQRYMDGELTIEDARREADRVVEEAFKRVG